MCEVKEEILHILVVGFHHKKGCQVEYSYPLLETLPDNWKNLTTLAMPDGAHNFDSDTSYFHLPSLDEPPKTVFGISCFQQVSIEKVKNKTEDMTRGTVQKAVCILSSVPLYGYLQVKMELVTAAFFDKGDFSEVSILKDAFHHLNDCLPGSIPQHLHDGLSVRDLVLRFRHRALLLFKLLLLERRVVMFYSPVAPLCSSLLSLVSLHPRLVEFGLYRSACTSCQPHEDEPKPQLHPRTDHGEEVNCDTLATKNTKNNLNCVNDKECSNTHVIPDSKATQVSKTDECVTEDEAFDSLLIEDFYTEHETVQQSLVEVQSEESSETFRNQYNLSHIANLDLAQCGLPLTLYTDGNLCLPYLSISYLDYISSPGVRGFLVGATNVLFKQKRQLTDVLVEMDGVRIETQCPELRKQLTLSTEDLRFAELLVRGTVEPKDEKEGGEEWIRAQFTLYMLSLLRTSLLPDGSKEMEHFNVNFMTAWKNTLSYNMWLVEEHSLIWELNPGHPCSGTLSVTDMRLRLSQAMSGSESGRRFNQAVSTTGKAVGSAISQARGAFSNWWNNLGPSEVKSAKVDI